jgi:hypothetical protein
MPNISRYFSKVQLFGMHGEKRIQKCTPIYVMHPFGAGIYKE